MMPDHGVLQRPSRVFKNSSGTPASPSGLTVLRVFDFTYQQIFSVCFQSQILLPPPPPTISPLLADTGFRASPSTPSCIVSLTPVLHFVVSYSTYNPRLALSCLCLLQQQLPVSPGRVISATVPHDYSSATVPHDYSSATVPHEYSSATVPHEYSSATVPHEYSSATVPHGYSSARVPHEYSSAAVPHEYSSATVPHEYSSATVPHQYSIATVPHEYSSATVPHEYSSATVPH
ncbi:hypothetical protein Hamer_G021403 [Homarus americanus]|uniref:Uncharacterized protein n=1 Tax=Homarus americanus TaxID=6706 RepID=A0A8J5KR62_HOMAM|nr:hypothetical protein Hamer_G021403 [Homarus americanus]